MLKQDRLFALRLFSVEETDSIFFDHGSLPRDNDGAIEFWRIKDNHPETFLCIVIIGLTTSGRAAWQEEEDTRKDFSIVLILQEQFCTSELSKVIQDAVSLILLYRTISLILDGFFKYTLSR